MIKYSLICDKEHVFEGWFGSGEDYENQRKRGFVECPSCGSNRISKALMAPNVSGTKKKDVVPMAAMQQAQVPAEMMERLRKFKKHVESNAENVGDRFPEEARKIHYGEAEVRDIYGKASLQEAASLAEEGVDVMPIPDLPEEKN